MKECPITRRGPLLGRIFAALIALTAACAAWAAPEDAPAPQNNVYPPILPSDTAPWARLERVVPGQRFDSPVALVPVPLGNGEVVVAQQRGLFQATKLRDPNGAPRVFLDLRERMKEIILFEEGVHGIAFHPNFRQNGLFYISYSQNKPRRTVISEMHATTTEPIVAQPATERILIEEHQPLAEHWGGQLVFGPDGMLYIGLGDGGLKDDPYHLAQNPWSLHGKILRICVDRRDAPLAYGIPSDNPFVGRQLYREEIYAMGFRNPWGICFDPVRQEMWAADVGGDLWEEVNRIVKGGNYGWSDREGPQALPAHANNKPLQADAKYIEPVYTYAHFRGEGICIIGGAIYRGNRVPELRGSYVFGDWGFGTVSALEFEKDTVSPKHRWLLHQRTEADGFFNPTHVTLDDEGEVVVLSQEGGLWTLVRGGAQLSDASRANGGFGH